MKICFVTRNEHKIREVQKLLDQTDIEIIPIDTPINEIQTKNVEELVKDKILKAFKQTGRPVLVEHTGLYIESLNDFPGGLTQIFWDDIQADRFSELFGCIDNPKLMAKTTIGYCDMKRIHIFEGLLSGQISKVPKGNRDFQWDCVFVPDGENKTLAELGEKKNEISMRKIAFDKFVEFIIKEGR